MCTYTSVFQNFTKLFFLLLISIGYIFISSSIALANVNYGNNDLTLNTKLNVESYNDTNYTNAKYKIKQSSNKHRSYNNKSNNTININNHYYEENDSLDLVDDMVDMMFFSKPTPDKMVLKSTGQLDLAIGFDFIINDNAFTYNRTFADEIAGFIEINPFYKVKFLDKIDIRLEMVRSRDDWDDEYGCNSDDPYYVPIRPIFNAENIYIIYNLIKKDFLTFYVGYAIYNRYDVLYMDKYSMVSYQSGHGNNFIVGSDIFIGYYTFLTLEYRVQQLKLQYSDYSYAKWALGLKTKIPILE